MKNLKLFQEFDIDKFLDKKMLIASEVGEWKDFKTGTHLGTKITAVIFKDSTNYGEGVTGNNAFEKFTIKVPKDITVPLNAEIKLVNPVGTPWGQNGFLTNLTVSASDVTVVANK